MSGTICLKLLSTNTLERVDRNKAWNRTGTNDDNLVPRQILCETEKYDAMNANLSLLSFLPEELEECLPIAEHDGHQTHIQAQRVTSGTRVKPSNLAGNF